jgi:hypothetical protein
MDVLDKFFTKFAYKFSNGYPDMNNDQDVLLLETLINRLLELDFKDDTDLPQEIENIRSDINNEGTYTVNAIQSKNKSNTKYWLYIDDVPATIRTAREAVTIDLQTKGLLPKGEMKGGDGENFYLEGEDGITYVIKGTGSKFTTSTNIKEGFVIMFYNALKKGWNSSKEPFNETNMPTLLTDLQSLGKDIYSGLGKSTTDVVSFLKNYEGGAGSKSAQVSLNDPLSSALRIFKDYSDGDMMRSEMFTAIKKRQESITGLPQDKVNPGDIFLKVRDEPLPKTKDIDVTGLEEINKLFVDKWGDKDKSLVSISLKQEKAQGGKAKSFLAKYKPKNVEGIVNKDYNLSDAELEYSDDQLDSAIDQLKKETEKKIGNSEFIDYKPGTNPSKSSRKKFKLAAYKSLDYLFTHLDKLGSSTPADGLVNMTAFGMSITSVNPTFFKVIGKGSGEIADTPERTPAGATAQLTPGTKITIKDDPTYGGLKIKVLVDVLEGNEIYSQYELELVMRSNGNIQNTIEIQKSTKK